MNIDKIFEYKEKLQKELTFEEISKLYREILYNKYEDFTFEDYQKIHCYQLLRANIDIFTQIVNGRTFDENYLRDTLKY